MDKATKLSDWAKKAPLPAPAVPTPEEKAVAEAARDRLEKDRVAYDLAVKRQIQHNNTLGQFTGREELPRNARKLPPPPIRVIRVPPAP